MSFWITTLRRAARGARVRQPTHVRTGSILHLVHPASPEPGEAGVRSRSVEDAVGLDVDLRAGELGGQTRVLAFLADRERKLVVGDQGADRLGVASRTNELVTFAGERA